MATEKVGFAIVLRAGAAHEGEPGNSVHEDVAVSKAAVLVSSHAPLEVRVAGISAKGPPETTDAVKHSGLEDDAIYLGVEAGSPAEARDQASGEDQCQHE